MSSHAPVGDPPFERPVFMPSPSPKFFNWATPIENVMSEEVSPSSQQEPAALAPEPEPMAFNLTMRDHFAGLALASLVEIALKSPGHPPKVAAELAYDIADGMMDERVKRAAARKGGQS